MRGELLVAIGRRGLDLDSLVEADAQTMNELLEIVIARFQRSERVAKGYHLALIELAARLAVRARAEPSVTSHARVRRLRAEKD